MISHLQKEIKKKYNLLGIDPSIPDGEIPKGLPAPEWVNEGPVYEIFVRNFSYAGNFAAVGKKLGYLKEMGIKTIWLMPIHPIGLAMRKGRHGSPYAIRDHLVIHPDYGTKQDFKNLVDMIHDHDMCIIMDMVLNHAAPDHVKYQKHANMFNTGLQHSPGEWSDIIEFNYHNRNTVDYLLNVMSYWVQEFGIDGYRCDVAGLIPMEFWNQASNQLLNLKPDLFLLAEWENRMLHEHSFHATYDWTLYFLMKEVNRNKRSASDIMTWHNESSDTYPLNALQLRFTENHDLPRTFDVFEYENFWPFTAFVFFSNGIPLIYNGMETGEKNEIPLFEKKIIDWSAINHKVSDFYRKLIGLRYSNQSLFDHKIINVVNDCADNVVTFMRKTENQLMIFVFNFSKMEQITRIQFPDLFKTSELKEFIHGENISVIDNCVTIKANEVMVFTT